MSLKTYSHDEIAELSMIETAFLILTEEKKAADFKDLFDRLAELKQFNQAQKDNSIAQFYTDLNTDGRFMAIGSNLWGLKQWYPFEQIDEEIAAAPKKKKAKKKKKKAVVEEDFDEDFDEEVVDELDLELVDEDFDELDDDDADDTDDDIDPSENLNDSHVKDNDYDGDYRSDKLDDEDREVVEEDTSYVGKEDAPKDNDDNYN